MKRQNKKNNLSLVLIVLAIVFIFIAIINLRGISVNINSDDFSINSISYNKDFKYSEIESIELLKDVEYGTRTFGMNAILLSTGNYKNNQFGKYHLAAYNNTDYSIKIKLKSSEIILFNLKDDDSTKKLFEELKNKI